MSDYDYEETDWSAVFNRPFTEFTDDELAKLHERLRHIDIDRVATVHYKEFLELMRLILQRGQNKVSYQYYNYYYSYHELWVSNVCYSVFPVNNSIR